MTRRENVFMIRALQAFGLAAALFCFLTAGTWRVHAADAEIVYVPSKESDQSAEQFSREISFRTRKTALKERELWDACSGSYWRGQLSAAERAFYDRIRETLLLVLCGTDNLVRRNAMYVTPFVYTSDLTRTQVQTVAQLFLYDEPAFFFIDSGFVQSIGYDRNGPVYGVAFQCFPAFSDGVIRRRIAEQLRDKVNNYLATAAGVSSKVDKAWVIYNRLIAEMTYSPSTYDQSVYGAFFEYRGVCATYSEAYAMIMNAAGVETLSVTSTYNDVFGGISGHEWNQICLDDGNWYAVDLTWSDQQGGADTTFFCVSDETLLQQDNMSGSWGGHVPEGFWKNLNRPVCHYDLHDHTEHVHTWDHGTVEVAATASAEGTLRYTCTTCGKVMYGTIPRTGHAHGMHRLYFPGTHEHFYTADENEYYHLITEAGWNDEGIGWYAPLTGAPVYRLYNPITTDHHYTMDLNEYMVLGENGWKQEGVGWYSDVNQAVPIYRQYAPSLVVGAHNFTKDPVERRYNVSTGAWIDEGIAWYGANP